MCYKTEVDLSTTRLLSSDPVVILTTLNKDGTNNAAAFGSYFRIGSTIIFAISPDCHTYRNIIESGEFVINIPRFKDLESIMKVSRSYPEGMDEIKASDLQTEPSLKVSPPTIVEFPASVECRLKWTREEGSHHLVAAEMICGRADEAYMDPAGRFDQVKAGVLHIVRYPEPVYIVADRYVQGVELMT